jgi:hypothetical protein
MKIDDLINEDYNQSGTSSVLSEDDGGATTSSSVASIFKPVRADQDNGPQIIKRTFMDYAIGEKRGESEKTTCPACEFIKKNNIGYSSKVKCFLCDKEFSTYPKKDTGAKTKKDKKD